MSGLVSLVIGVVILAWPDKPAMVIVGITAVYALIAGLANLASACSPAPWGCGRASATSRWAQCS